MGRREEVREKRETRETSSRCPRVCVWLSVGGGAEPVLRMRDTGAGGDVREKESCSLATRTARHISFQRSVQSSSSEWMCLRVSCQAVCVKPLLSRSSLLLPSTSVLLPSPATASRRQDCKVAAAAAPLLLLRESVTDMIDDQVLRMKATMKNDSTRVKKKTKSLSLFRADPSLVSRRAGRQAGRQAGRRESDERKRNFIFSTSTCVCLCCQSAGEPVPSPLLPLLSRTGEEGGGRSKKSDERRGKRERERGRGRGSEGREEEERRRGRPDVTVRKVHRIPD